MKKIVAFDLDGTCLDENGNISQFLIDSFKKLREKDFVPTFITGRNYAAFISMVKDVDSLNVLACSNGGLVFNPKNSEIYLCNLFDKEAVENVYAEAEKHGLHASVFTAKKMYCLKKAKEWIYTNAAPYAAAFTYIDSEEYFSYFDKCLKMDVLGDPDRVERLLADYKNPYGLNVVKGMFGYSIEITPKITSKGEALKKMCELLDVDIKNTYTIGDSYNDIEMFKTCGTAFVQNDSPDDVKEYGDIIIPYPGKQGLVWVVDYLLRDR